MAGVLPVGLRDLAERGEYAGIVGDRIVTGSPFAGCVSCVGSSFIVAGHPMTESADFLLTKAQEHIEAIQHRYGTIEPEAVLSEHLYYDIRSTLQDQLSALDWTANAVHETHGKPFKSGWSPYFPIESDPPRFTDTFDKNLKGVRDNRPDIADAFERHQPYQAGKAELAYIHKLARVNKHRGFTAHTRKDSRLSLMLAGGGVLMAMGSFGMTLGGVPPEYLTGQIVKAHQIHSAEHQVGLIDAEVVDWYFVDPEVSVLGTLICLQRIATEAVTEIRQVAGL